MFDEEEYFDEEEKIETDVIEEEDEESYGDNELEEDEKNFNILCLLNKSKKTPNMYFDEELVKDLIVNQYQPYLDYEINEKGKRVCVSRDRASKEVEAEIMANLLLIANAIINKYRYWRFESLEDLRAESMKAMWVYLPNFSEGKGSAFDLFSIICKRHLLNFTLKNYKHRITTDVDACYDIAANENYNSNLFIEDLERTFLHIIDTHFVKEKRKKYIELTAILIQYIDKNKTIVGKNDLLASFKEFGYKSTEWKNFIEDMSKFKEEFYDLARR